MPTYPPMIAFKYWNEIFKGEKQHSNSKLSFKEVEALVTEKQIFKNTFKQIYSVESEKLEL